VQAATLVEEAVETALGNAHSRTADVGGDLGCAPFAAYLCRAIRERVPS
jgi:isocitrate/isopropylmalate dehydrogenase